MLSNPSNLSHNSSQCKKLGPVTTRSSTLMPRCSATSSSVMVHSPHGRWKVCASCLHRSFHQGQTRYISAQLLDNDDLQGAMETILQDPQLNSAKFYVVTYHISQPQPSSPQPSCPQLQLPPPPQLPYNNLNLNDSVSSYNNLET